MNTLLLAASNALQRNDVNALEQLVGKCEHIRDQGGCASFSPEDWRTIKTLAEILQRQLTAAGQHLAICSRLSSNPRKDFTLWER